MTLSNPRALDDFVVQAKIGSVAWYSQRADKVSGAGSGQYLTVETSPPLWGADVTIRTLSYAKARIIRAMINSLSRPGQSFYLYDPTSKYPSADPTGALLGVSVPVIAAIGSDRSSASFSGFPSNYKITRGDYFHIDYGSNPARRAFIEFSEDGTADGTGKLATTAFYPNLPTGVTVGSALTLIKPSVKVSIVPGSITLGTAEGMFVSGMGFKALQKI